MKVFWNQRTDIGRAAAWAAELHGEQVDRAGLPYTDHLRRVAERIRSAGVDTEITAWLHDTVEDTAASVDDVRRMFGPAVARSVELLTRRPGRTYQEYIETVAASGDAAALAVKAADLDDHLEHTPEALSDSLRERYLKARERLRAAAAGQMGVPA